jgi:ATP-dependent DNA ligase
LLRRHGLTKGWRLRQARRWCPVQYLVFDLLYHRGRCLLNEPLARRRAALAALCAGLDLPEMLFSAGVVGAGTALYALALAQGHEGVVAKRLASTYRPGRRSPTWQKIKPGGRANRSEGLLPGFSARDLFVRMKSRAPEANANSRPGSEHLEALTPGPRSS